MAGAMLYVDDAIDILDVGSNDLRVVTPHGGFTVRDPARVVRRVADACRAGAARDHVIAEFQTTKERDAAEKALSLLERRRVLTPQRQPQGGIDPLAHWIRHLAGSEGKRLPPLSIVGLGEMASAIASRVQDLGFDLVSLAYSVGAVPIVAALDEPDMEKLRDLNAQAARMGRPFLPIWLNRSAVNVGPFIEPGATGCLECLHHREEAARRRTEPSPTHLELGVRVSGTMAQLGAGLAGCELLRWAYDAHVETDLGVAWRFDMLSFSLSGSRVLRLPRCPVCGVSPCRA